MTSVTGPLSTAEVLVFNDEAKRNAPSGFEAVVGPNAFLNYVGPLFRSQNTTPLCYGLFVDARHSNRSHVMHGGALLTFAHMAIDDALRQTYAKKAPHMISIQSQFVRSGAIGDWIECAPEVTQKTRDILFVRGKVTTNAEVNLTVTTLWSHAER